MSRSRKVFEEVARTLGVKESVPISFDVRFGPRVTLVDCVDQNGASCTLRIEHDADLPSPVVPGRKFRIAFEDGEPAIELTAVAVRQS